MYLSEHGVKRRYTDRLKYCAGYLFESQIHVIICNLCNYCLGAVTIITNPLVILIKSVKGKDGFIVIRST